MVRSSPYSDLRVRCVLGPAQFGDVLLCEDQAKHYASASTSLVVVKQVDLRERQLRCQRLGASACDDPFRELEVAAAIQALGGHANLVQYIEAMSIDDHTLGIIMEYCNEGDLLQRLEATPGNRMSELEALQALQQIVDGLQFLHNGVGVAHRDISLENIVVHDGQCKISDFGVSIRTTMSSQASERVGKLGYMAPEVVAARTKPYDAKQADMWSLGILFFILLTGSPLVDIASTECPRFIAVCRIGVRRILSQWGIARELHEETLDLCEQLLQVNPAARISLDRMQVHPAFTKLLQPTTAMQDGYQA